MTSKTTNIGKSRYNFDTAAFLTEAATGVVLYRKCVLRNLAKFTGKQLRQSPFF